MDRTVLCSMIALALASGPVAAQGVPRPDSVATSRVGPARAVPAYRNRIIGVFDAQTYQPVDGAEVSDVMLGTTALTSSTGNVSLFFLPEGSSLVRIRKLGYAAQTFLVSIAPEDPSTITVVLARVTELTPVVTTDSSPHYLSAALNGFEARKKAGFGHFIDEAQSRKDEGRQMSNEIVAHIPGVIMTVGGSLMSGRTPCPGRALTPCMHPSCLVAVYTDGVLTKPAPNFSRTETNDYAAVEFYAGAATIPPQYNGPGSECGVLLLWTRER